MHLRFTIRDSLWLMLVVALAVEWWIDHQQHSPAAYEFQVDTGGIMLIKHSGETKSIPIDSPDLQPEAR